MPFIPGPVVFYAAIHPCCCHTAGFAVNADVSARGTSILLWRQRQPCIHG